MKPLTDRIPKALINIAGKTLIEWAVDRYDKSGISDIIVAVGWKGNMVEEFVSESYLDVKIVHVPNYETGPLQTLLTAIESFDGDFLLSPVDAMIDTASMIGFLEHHSDYDTQERLNLAVSSNADSGTLVKLGHNNLVLGIGDVSSQSNKTTRSAMMFIGHTRIRELCKSTIEDGKTKVVNLLEQLLVDGARIEYYDIEQPLFDIDTLSDILVANQHFLQRGSVGKRDSIFITHGDNVQVGDSLVLGSKITLKEGIDLQGPVLIGANCEIGNYCRLGPNVTIGSNAKIEADCDISNAVIFGKSQIPAQSSVHKAIIYKSAQYNVEV